MVDKRKPVVGEELYIVHSSRGGTRKSDQWKCTVTKVGRKYFTTKDNDGWREVQFYIATWQESGDVVTSVLYENKEEHTAIVRYHNIHNIFKKTFRDLSYHNEKYTLEQYEEAAKILGIEIP